MWAQEWGALIDDVIPYPDSANVDVTNVLKEQAFSMHFCIAIICKASILDYVLLCFRLFYLCITFKFVSANLLSNQD